MGPRNFEYAFNLLKQGRRLQRDGWNGKGMWLSVRNPDTNSEMTHPYLVMSIPDCEEGTRYLPWQPAQVDLFAEDWSIVE